jgi:hypothetical protein
MVSCSDGDDMQHHKKAAKKSNTNSRGRTHIDASSSTESCLELPPLLPATRFPTSLTVLAMDALSAVSWLGFVLAVLEDLAGDVL